MKVELKLALKSGLASPISTMSVVPEQEQSLAMVLQVTELLGRSLAAQATPPVPSGLVVPTFFRFAPHWCEASETTNPSSFTMNLAGSQVCPGPDSAALAGSS